MNSILCSHILAELTTLLSYFDGTSCRNIVACESNEQAVAVGILEKHCCSLLLLCNFLAYPSSVLCKTDIRAISGH